MLIKLFIIKLNIEIYCYLILIFLKLLCFKIKKGKIMGFETLNQKEFEKLKEESQPEVSEEEELLELQKQAWKGGKGELNKMKEKKENREMIKKTREKYENMDFGEIDTEYSKRFEKILYDKRVSALRRQIVGENLIKEGFDYNTFYEIWDQKKKERAKKILGETEETTKKEVESEE